MWRTREAALANTLRLAVGIVSGLLLVFYFFVAATVVPWEPSSIGQLLLLYRFLISRTASSVVSDSFAVAAWFYRVQLRTLVLSFS